MSNDLEDFLRRAAQRRQAKAQPQAVPLRPKPEYTSHHAERLTTHHQAGEEEPLEAIIVNEQAEDPYAMQRRRIADAQALAAKEAGYAAQRLAKIQRSIASQSPAGDYKLSGNIAADLMQMLRSPGGIQQAILLREIIDRPEHRW